MPIRSMFRGGMSFFTPGSWAPKHSTLGDLLDQEIDLGLPADSESTAHSDAEVSRPPSRIGQPLAMRVKVVEVDDVTDSQPARWLSGMPKPSVTQDERKMDREGSRKALDFLIGLNQQKSQKVVNDVERFIIKGQYVV